MQGNISVSNWLWQNSRKNVQKNANPPPFYQKLFTFVKQFILKFKEILEFEENWKHWVHMIGNS